MAGYDDDFQGYAIGATVPFGSWIDDPGAFTKSIVAGFGPDGTDRSFQLAGIVAVDPLITGFQTSFTEFVAIRKTEAGQILAFSNGPNGSSHTFTLLTLQVEQDGTITAIGPDGPTDILGNTGDAWFNFYASNFLQVNVTLSDVLVLGVNMVRITGEIALNGRSVMTFAETTATASGPLATGTAAVNRFQLASNGANYGAFTLQSITGIVSYPHPGSPLAIATQAPIAVGLLPNTGKISIYQVPMGVDVLPNNALLQIYQMVIAVDVFELARIGRRRAEYIHRRHFPGD